MSVEHSTPEGGTASADRRLPGHPGAVLGLKNIAKRYGGRTVLEDVTMTVEPAKVAVVVGPNGAGKSTLLRVMSGITRPTAGEVVLDPGPFGRQIAAVFEEPNLYGHLSVRDNLRVLGPTGRLPDDELFREYLDAYELGPLLKRKGRELSFGQRRKVTLLAALSHQAPLVLLDEPTNGLDEQTRMVFVDQCRAMVGRGQALVATGQDHAVLGVIADDTWLLTGHRLERARQGTERGSQYVVTVDASGDSLFALQTSRWVHRLERTDGGVVLYGAKNELAAVLEHLTALGEASSIRAVRFLDGEEEPRP